MLLLPLQVLCQQASSQVSCFVWFWLAAVCTALDASDYAAVGGAAGDAAAAAAAADAAMLAVCDPHNGSHVLAVCAMAYLPTASQ